MNRKAKKVAALASRAQQFLVQGDSVSAEAAYKHAFTEAVRLLGLRHASTRNLLSIYAMCLKGAQKHELALQYEALYWKTGRPESYRLGELFGKIDPDVQEFLKQNANLVEDFGQQISKDCRTRQWQWTAAENVSQALKAYVKGLREYVLELGK
jgi:hypothetical protein